MECAACLLLHWKHPASWTDHVKLGTMQRGIVLDNLFPEQSLTITALKESRFSVSVLGRYNLDE